MDALDALLTRRSIRRFTGEDVDESAVTKMISAATAAPSAMNQQPWSFVVLRDADLQKRIPEIHPHAAMAKQAPVSIVLCGDLTNIQRQEFLAQDCAAATENLLLAAHALGLGAVWCGIHPNEDRESDFRSLLGLPESVVPFAVIPIGHPAEEKPPSERYDPSRVHRDGW